MRLGFGGKRRRSGRACSAAWSGIVRLRTGEEGESRVTTSERAGVETTFSSSATAMTASAAGTVFRRFPRRLLFPEEQTAFPSLRDREIRSPHDRAKAPSRRSDGNSDTGSETRPFSRRLSLTALAPTNFRARATKGSNFRATRFWDARFPGFSATGFLPRPRATFLRSGPGSQAAPACAGTPGRPAPTGA